MTYMADKAVYSNRPMRISIAKKVIDAFKFAINNKITVRV
jgi:hypothetical protein